MKIARQTINFNKDWKFTRDDNPRAWYKGEDDSGWRTVTLPHDWSIEEPFSREHSSGTGYCAAGIGWYRKHFTLPESLNGFQISVTFDGIYNNCQIWCNSHNLGKRPYGYSEIHKDLTPFLNFGEEENVISVKVNHREAADSRWYTGSGIYRNVTLHCRGSIHIGHNGVFAVTADLKPGAAGISTECTVVNSSPFDASVDILQTIHDHRGAKIVEEAGQITVLSRASGVVSRKLVLANPRIWSPDSPYLYSLRTVIFAGGDEVDRYDVPLGIRSVRFESDRGFYLNDENMKLKGVCIHHDAGCLGSAVPKAVWRLRLERLKEMGCNAIRMSHNPPASDLLDLCDEMGFLVMDEAFDEWEGIKNKWSAGHNVYPPKHFGYGEDFPDWHETDLKDMILRDRRHPSIIMWSIGNEVDYPNDPYCHRSFKTMTGNNDADKPAAEREYDPHKPDARRLADISARLVSLVKKWDDSRPVTAAIAFPELSNDIGYTDTLDMVGYNYKEHLYEQDHGRFPGRVIFGSENGADLDHWKAVADNPYICAQFVWTGIDYLGEAKGWPVRASQSGFLDLAGNPKPRFYFRKSLWSSLPMVWIGTVGTGKDTHGDNRWLGELPHWNYSKGEQVTVICYSNCERVELFLNGGSLGTGSPLSRPKGYGEWNLPFSAGELKAVGYHSSGAVTEHVLQSTGAADRLSMGISRLTGDGVAPAIFTAEIAVEDLKGNRLVLDDREVSVAINEPGRLLGLENGCQWDPEPYYSGKRRLHYGRLRAFFSMEEPDGEIRVTASAPGVESAVWNSSRSLGRIGEQVGCRPEQQPEVVTREACFRPAQKERE